MVASCWDAGCRCWCADVGIRPLVSLLNVNPVSSRTTTDDPFLPVPSQIGEPVLPTTTDGRTEVGISK